MPTINNWVQSAFTIPACRNLARTLARRSFAAGFKAAKNKTVFDGRAYQVNLTDFEIDQLFVEFLQSDIEEL